MWPEESHLGSWGTLTQLYLDPWHLPQKRFSGQVKAKQSEWLYWLSKKMTHLKGVRVSEPVCVHVREMQMCSGDAAFGTLKLLHLQLIWNLLGKVVHSSYSQNSALEEERCQYIEWPAVWERRTGRSRTPPGRCLTYVQVPNGGT